MSTAWTELPMKCVFPVMLLFSSLKLRSPVPGIDSHVPHKVHSKHSIRPSDQTNFSVSWLDCCIFLFSVILWCVCIFIFVFWLCLHIMVILNLSEYFYILKEADSSVMSCPPELGVLLHFPPPVSKGILCCFFLYVGFQLH